MSLGAPQDAAKLHADAVRAHAEGDHAGALRMLELATALAPTDAAILNTVGAVRLAQGDLAGAEKALTGALARDPRGLEARFNLAVLHIRAARPTQALAELDRLLAMYPDFDAARIERALLWLQGGRNEEGLADLVQAQQRDPQDARLAGMVALACERVGTERFTNGDYAGAARAFQDQWRRDPARGRNAAFNLAMSLERAGAPEVAREVLDDAVGAGHDDAAMLTELVSRKAQACDWPSLDALVERLRERLRADPREFAGYPQITLYFEAFGARDQRRAAEAWVAARLPQGAPRPPAPPKRDKLRVGFLSGEFRDHPNASLMVGMLEALDRGRFELMGYAYGTDDGSAMRRRMAAAFDRFDDVGALDDAGIAARIRADELDVLLDISGYIRGSRPGILAHRPAHVQGHFLGYPGPLGSPFVDFLVADRHVVPPELEDAYGERILRMPGCYQPNERREIAAAPSRASCGLERFDVVLCSFNQPVKVTAATFARWCALLRELPGAGLWIGAFDATAEKNMLAAAAEHGVDPARVVIAPRLPMEEHLARLACADLALDTFPYTSHTTASDMLAAGVPLLTVRGETFASRVASSVLANAGLDDWIFDDVQACHAATLALARDGKALAAARARAKAAGQSPLFDAGRYARDFETLLREAAALQRSS